ncbi:hypothetical protein Hsw_0309 [Hymenobacter swuensis DY53]|uniref:DUF1232 domain-containing protein n=1 Tax=Hymenobacter swuensis DY53 TaxID=1227739 RepID=W8ERW9_9BACT|nr:hypothetical protein Hsw_0309 [Hymenobacter swuensis DY53]
MDKQTPKGEDIASSPIFKKFVGKAEEYIKKPTRMKQLLNDAYTKASDKKDVGSIAHEAWETLQTMLRLVRTSVSGEYTGLPTSTVVAAVAVTIYFLSPIDLIPDFIPVLGLLDDVALVAWFSTTIKEELDRFLEWEKTRPSVVEDAVVVSDDEPARPVASASGHPKTSSEVHTSATPYSDVATTTTDSTREPNESADSRPNGGDAGGNVR